MLILATHSLKPNTSVRVYVKEAAACTDDAGESCFAGCLDWLNIYWAQGGCWGLKAYLACVSGSGAKRAIGKGLRLWNDHHQLMLSASHRHLLLTPFTI